MSRIGKNPVVLPADVQVSVSAHEIIVKGPLGTLKTTAHSAVKVEMCIRDRYFPGQACF